MQFNYPISCTAYPVRGEAYPVAGAAYPGADDVQPVSLEKIMRLLLI